MKSGFGHCLQHSYNHGLARSVTERAQHVRQLGGGRILQAGEIFCEKGVWSLSTTLLQTWSNDNRDTASIAHEAIRKGQDFASR